MKTLYESGENYLEAIMVLKSKGDVVLSIDVANYMGFSKASVSRAMKILKEESYITITNGAISFTEKGKTSAAAIYERHKIITEFLTDVLGVSKAEADADACRIEHVIGEETFAAIKDKVKGK